MASGTIGDKTTSSNNVTGAVADYASLAEGHATLGTNETATFTIIRINAAVDTSTVTLSAGGTGTRTVTAHADALVNAPTYAAATSRARVDVAGDAVIISAENWTVEKISALHTGFGAGFRNTNSSGTSTVRRCVSVGSDSDFGNRGFMADGAGTAVWSNSAAVRFHAIGFDRQAGTVNAYHNSAYSSNAASSFKDITSVNACVSQGGYLLDEFSGCSGDYNVSQDATAPGSSSTKYYRSTSGWFANTGSGTEDLSLATGAKGKWVTDGKDAIDQTGWPADVATDIVGTTRSAPIDPGVWQTPAASGGITCSMSGAGVVAAVLLGAAAIASAFSGTGSVAATLLGAAAIRCAAAGSGSLSATLSGAAAMQCAAAGSGALAGTLNGAASMVCAMAGTGTVTATCQNANATICTMAGQGSLVASLTAAGAMQCAMAGHGTLTGTLSGGAPTTSTGNFDCDPTPQLIVHAVARAGHASPTPRHVFRRGA